MFELGVPGQTLGLGSEECFKKQCNHAIVFHKGAIEFSKTQEMLKILDDG